MFLLITFTDFTCGCGCKFAFNILSATSHNSLTRVTHGFKVLPALMHRATDTRYKCVTFNLVTLPRFKANQPWLYPRIAYAISKETTSSSLTSLVGCVWGSNSRPFDCDVDTSTTSPPQRLTQSNEPHQNENEIEISKVFR